MRLLVFKAIPEKECDSTVWAQNCAALNEQL